MNSTDSVVFIVNRYIVRVEPLIIQLAPAKEIYINPINHQYIMDNMLSETGRGAESVEHWSRVREIVGSNPVRVKPMPYQIDTCRFLARCSALLG